MSLRFAAIASILSLAVLHAQTGEAPPALRGKIEDRIYISPTGAFRMAIPVLPELGGTVIDTDNVVTFEDGFSLHVSVAAFPMDNDQRMEDETRGRRDYLIYFFSNYVLPDFQKRAEGAKIENAVFRPGTADGALIVYTLLPGGSMFADRLSVLGESDPKLVAKRGNMLFVKNDWVFIISTELAERVIEHSTYHKTVAEEDELLRTRLLDLLGRMQFPAARPAK